MASWNDLTHDKAVLKKRMQEVIIELSRLHNIHKVHDELIVRAEKMCKTWNVVKNLNWGLFFY